MKWPKTNKQKKNREGAKVNFSSVGHYPVFSIQILISFNLKCTTSLYLYNGTKQWVNLSIDEELFYVSGREMFLVQ